jgi:TldD protein
MTAEHLPAVRQLLEDSLQYAKEGELLELRYHHKALRTLTARDGMLERSLTRTRSGVGVRVLAGGTWGFACTSEASPAAVARAIAAARAHALGSAALRRDKRAPPPPTRLAVGDFAVDDIDEQHSLDERIALVLRLAAHARGAHARICSASTTLTELRSEKAIVTSDGAACTVRLVRPELSISAVAEDHGQRMAQAESLGATGGWSCLFVRDPAQLAEKAARRAVELLDAPVPAGGRAQVILSPDLVGLLVHEAIGHTVEADFVQSGTVATGKLGERVASPLVTLRDSGASVHAAGAGGTEPVDDEGVPSTTANIIEDGVLVGYLHNRESAARFGVAPTGNARAWEFSDTPLIRMRNTYIEPGESELGAMIEGTPDGWLLEGARNGQADSTGEFTFGVAQARQIQGGKLGPPMRGVTVTGLAFDVLQTVDAVSREFAWDLGSGHCGKGQPAKVDAGGPYLRCTLTLAGAQA